METRYGFSYEQFQLPMMSDPSRNSCAHIAICNERKIVAVRNSNDAWETGSIVQFDFNEWDALCKSINAGQYQVNA
jgi:hypothetical protein